MKINGVYKRIKNNPHENNGVIISDVLIQLTGYKTKKHYPKPIRKIKYYDAEYRHTYEFITNDLQMAAQDRADIYKRRWQVELFFKWIKQNVKIKSFRLSFSWRGCYRIYRQ
jgi:IS4 transposase